MTKWLIKIAGFILLFFLFAYARAMIESRRQYFRGEEALENGEYEDCIFYFKNSSSWYTPFNPYVQKSLTRLWQIGRKAELEGEKRLALEAFSAIRSSILSTRSFYIPNRKMLKDANRRIAHLMAMLPHPKAFREKSRKDIERIHLEILQTVDQPAPLWSMVVILGFFTWIGAVIYFIFFGLDSSLKVIKSKFVYALVVFLAGFGAWIIGMFQA